jgi:hypothetical protein
VWRDLDDEVGVEGCGDAFEEGDGRDDAAGFEAGEGGLGHARAGGELDLGQLWPSWEPEADVCLAIRRVIGITGLHTAPPVTRPDHLVL